MLSKEEIEEALRIDNNFENMLKMQKQQDKTYQLELDKKTLIKAGNTLVDYIEQLESDKQKLIEKLEEESKQLEHNILTMSIDTGNNYSLKLICEAKGMKQQNDRILSILKGENYEK